MAQPMHMGTSYWPFWLVVTALSHEPELDGRPVIDKTGLEGSYNCNISWSRAGSGGDGAVVLYGDRGAGGVEAGAGEGTGGGAGGGEY